MLHALRRANPQQSNDQGETESISYQAWRVFVTIWNFLLLAGWMKNPTEETSSLRRHAKESFREWLCLILVRNAALKKFYTKPDQHYFFLLTIEFNRGLRGGRNVPYSRPILSRNHCQG